MIVSNCLIRSNTVSRASVARLRRPEVYATASCARILRYTDYVQKNLTLTIGEDLLRAARKAALDRNTSVNQLVRDYLAQLVKETDQQQSALAEIENIFRTTKSRAGRITWTRDELHERQ